MATGLFAQAPSISVNLLAPKHIVSNSTQPRSTMSTQLQPQPQAHSSASDQDTQTEVSETLPDFAQNAQMQPQKGHWKANMQMLVAELDASRDLNRKLCAKLAKTERELSELQIQHELERQRIESNAAKKITETIRSLHEAQNTGLNPLFQSTSDSAVLSGRSSVVFSRDSSPRRLLAQLRELDDSSPAAVAHCCMALLRCVQQLNGSSLSPISSDHSPTNRRDDELASLQQEMAELKTNLESDNSKLQVQLNESVGEIQRLIEKCKVVEDVDARNAELQEEVSSLREKYEEACRQVQEVQENLKESTVVEAQLSDLRAEKSKLEAEVARNERLHREIEELKVRLDEEADRFSQLKADHNEQIEARTMLEREVNQSKRDVDIFRIEREALDHQLHDATDKIIDLEKQVEKQSKEKAAADAQTVDSARDRDRCEQLQARLEHETYTSRRKIDELTEECDRLREEMRRLHSNQKINAADAKLINGDVTVVLEQRVLTLTRSNADLTLRNEELKRIINVLRRKVLASNVDKSAATDV